MPTLFRRRALALALALPLMTPAPALAADPATSTAAQRQDLAVTIYNDDLGLVKDARRVDLSSGRVPLQFQDVASRIDPTSVGFRTLAGPGGVDVLEQNYAYDLITPAKLMQKYIGRTVEIRQPAETGRPERTLQATLVSTNEGYVYRIGDEIHLQPPGQVVLPRLPEALVAQPSLVWTLDVARRGAHRLEASYLTGGMSWHADYVLVSRQDSRQADLTAWVTLKNESGATYPDARLTLVAGDVHRAEAPQPAAVPVMARAADESVGGSQFTQQALFEYHSYNLERRTTLANNQTKQLSLMSASAVPTRKVFVFDSQRYRPMHQNDRRGKVQVMLEFWNKREAKLGMPLPKGRVRVYQEDAARKLQFVGEDRIDHTPKDEKLRITLGNAFDVVGERRQTAQRRIDEHTIEQSHEIVLRNHKDQAVEVEVLEHLWGDWQVITKSHPFRKPSATELEFPVKVPANGATKVTYSVRLKT